MRRRPAHNPANRARIASKRTTGRRIILFFIRSPLF
jgi:hypothetical protein